MDRSSRDAAGREPVDRIVVRVRPIKDQARASSSNSNWISTAYW